MGYLVRLAGYVALVLTLVSLAGQNTHAAGSGVFVDVKSSDGSDASVQRYKLYGASHALVIGIDNYSNGWPRLSNAVKDAREVAKALESRGFEVDLMIDPTGRDLRERLRAFYAIKGADPEARLFVWYAGHGHTERGEGYLVPADAPASDDPQFRITALHMGDVGSMVRLAEAKHTLAVFDSCFAGTVFSNARAKPPAAITKAAVRPVRQFLTSGDADQEVSDNGSFRQLFLSALAGEEAADLNDDGYLTGTELGFYLEDRVLNLTQGAQTPRSGKLRDQRFDQGDFIFLLPDAEVNIQITPPAADEASGKALDLAFWQSIQGSDNPDLFEAYLAQFPQGTFAALAHDRIESLTSDGGSAGLPGDSAAQSAALPKIPPVPGKPGTLFRDCESCPEMVVVPSGSFTMGSPSDEKGRDDDESPRHRVTIDYGLAVGKYEVTRGEFAAFVAATGYASGNSCWTFEALFWWARNGRTWKDPGYSQDDDHPAACLNWEDSQAYAAWLSGKTGKSYRLLSEAEWEYVARGDKTGPYATGTAISEREARFNPFNGRTERVGSYGANAFGLHDVHGNLWEWTADCYNQSYAGAPDNGDPWTSGDCGRHVLRGGSWYDLAPVLRTASRHTDFSGLRAHTYGLRVARTLP